MQYVRELSTRDKARAMAQPAVRSIELRNNMIVHRANTSYNINTPVSAALKSNTWQGKRCFIIGGGESLKNLDLSKLQGERVIGINRAFEKYPVDILYMMDAPFYESIVQKKLDVFTGEPVLERFRSFKGVKVALSPITEYKYPPDIYVVRMKVDGKLSVDLNDGIFGGTNSGFGAIQLAMCLGANPIYLLGYDMCAPTTTHWHKGYPNQTVEGMRTKLLGYLLEMQEAASDIKSLGFTLYNVNKESALTCFPFAEYNSLWQ